MNIWNVVSQMLMMLAMLAVGYGAAKLHIVTQEGNRTLSAILLSIAFPCMVLSSVSAPGERDDMLLVWSLIAGVVLFTALPLLAWVLVKVTRIGGNEESAWETMLYLPNVAFMGIPVAGAIWGNTAVLIVAIMNLVFSFLLFGVAAIHFGCAADKKKVDGIVGVRRFPWRALLSPSMLASYAALIIYICRIPVPGTLGGTFSYLGAMTTPLSMMISGVNLAAMPLRQVFGNGKTYVMSFLRLIVMPLAFYPLFRLLLGSCGIEILLPVVIFLAGMPCASTTPVLAEAAGLREESRLCSLGVLVSTVLSVVTIPLLYALTAWLGV